MNSARVVSRVFLSKGARWEFISEAERIIINTDWKKCVRAGCQVASKTSVNIGIIISEW